MRTKTIEDTLMFHFLELQKRNAILWGCIFKVLSKDLRCRAFRQISFNCFQNARNINKQQKQLIKDFPSWKSND